MLTTVMLGAAGCSSNTRLSIQQESLVVDIPVSNTHRFNRSDYEPGIKEYVQFYTRDLVSEEERHRILTTVLAEFREFPATIDRQRKTGAKEQLDPEILRKALIGAMNTNGNQVFTHHNVSTHKNATTTLDAGAILVGSSEARLNYTLTYLKTWVWAGGSAKATGHFAVDVLIEPLKRNTKETVPIRLTVQSISKEAPKALGIRTISETQFHMDQFFKAMAGLSTSYWFARGPGPQDPYTSLVRQVSKHARVRALAALKIQTEETQKKERLDTANFRKSIAPGNDSQCGMVVEVKRPIAQVQTTRETKWVRIDALYPAGIRKPCPL